VLHTTAGGRCSKTLTQALAATVAKDPDYDVDLCSAITRGFAKTNSEFLKRAERFNANDGSTAITVFLRQRKLYVANVGDSRAILCCSGNSNCSNAAISSNGFVSSTSSSSSRAVDLSFDHKPNKPEERRRIQELGGRVVYSFGVPRVNGILAVSRAFGDRNMRGAINAEPELTLHSLERGDNFLLLATDGLWDVMSSSDACSIVHQCMVEHNYSCQKCADTLVAIALHKGTMDNTTALVVDLRNMWSTSATTAATTSSGGTAGDYHSNSTSAVAARAATAASSMRSSMTSTTDGSSSSGSRRQQQEAAVAQRNRRAMQALQQHIVNGTTPGTGSGIAAASSNGYSSPADLLLLSDFPPSHASSSAAASIDVSETLAEARRALRESTMNATTGGIATGTAIGAASGSGSSNGQTARRRPKSSLSRKSSSSAASLLGGSELGSMVLRAYGSSQLDRHNNNNNSSSNNTGATTRHSRGQRRKS
jgi:serine/threonine protein phosphatase PrpC